MAIWFSLKEAVVLIILCGIAICDKDWLETIKTRSDDPPELTDFLQSLLEQKNEFKKIRDVARAIRKAHRRENLDKSNSDDIQYHKFPESKINPNPRKYSPTRENNPLNDVFPYSDNQDEDEELTFSSFEDDNNGQAKNRRRKRNSMWRKRRGYDITNYNSDKDFGLSSISVLPRSRSGVQRVPGNRYEQLLYKQESKASHCHSNKPKKVARGVKSKNNENNLFDIDNKQRRPFNKILKHIFNKKTVRKTIPVEMGVDTEELHKAFHWKNKYNDLHMNPSHAVEVQQTLALDSGKPVNDFSNSPDINEGCCIIPKHLHCESENEMAIVYQARPDLKTVSTKKYSPEKVNTLEDVDDPTSAIEQHELSTKPYEIKAQAAKEENKIIDLFGTSIPKRETFSAQQANNMIHSNDKGLVETDKRKVNEADKIFVEDQLDSKTEPATLKESKLVDKTLLNEQTAEEHKQKRKSVDFQTIFNARKLQWLSSSFLSTDNPYGVLDYENGKHNSNGLENKIRVKRSISELLGMTDDEDYSEDIPDDYAFSDSFAEDYDSAQTREASAVSSTLKRDLRKIRSEDDYQEDGDPDKANTLLTYHKKTKEKNIIHALKDPQLVNIDNTVGFLGSKVAKSSSASAKESETNKEITIEKSCNTKRLENEHQAQATSCICNTGDGSRCEGCTNIKEIDVKNRSPMCTNQKCNCRFSHSVRFNARKSPHCGEITTTVHPSTFHTKVTVVESDANATLKPVTEGANDNTFKFNQNITASAKTTNDTCKRGENGKINIVQPKLIQSLDNDNIGEAQILDGDMSSFAHHSIVKPKNKINLSSPKSNLPAVYTRSHTKHNENDFNQISSLKEREMPSDSEFVGDVKSANVKNDLPSNRQVVLNTVTSFKDVVELKEPQKKIVKKRAIKRQNNNVEEILLHELNQRSQGDIVDMKSSENAINTAPFEKCSKLYKKKYRSKAEELKLEKKHIKNKQKSSHLESNLVPVNRFKHTSNNARQVHDVNRIKRDYLLHNQKQQNYAYQHKGGNIEKLHQIQKKAENTVTEKPKCLLSQDKGLNPSLNDIKSPSNKGGCAFGGESNSKQGENTGQMKEAINGQLASQIVDATFQKLGKHQQLKARFGNGLNRSHNVKSQMKGLDEFRNSETQDDIQHTEELLTQIMEVLNKIIVDQVNKRTCKHISPELRHYLARITKSNREAQNSAEESRISDEGYPLPLVKSGKYVETNTKSDQGEFLFNAEGMKSKQQKDEEEIKNKMTMIKEMLDKYEHMSKTCKVKVEGVELYLKKHLCMLKNILKHIQQGESTKKEECPRPRKSYDSSPYVNSNPFKTDYIHQFDNNGLGNQNVYKPDLNVNKIIQQNVDKMMKSKNSQWPKLSNSDFGFDRQSNKLKKLKIRNFKTEHAVSNKYKRLVNAADILRKKRETQELLGRLFGKTEKRSISNENYETIKSLNKDTEDNAEIGFEIPTVYSLVQ